MAELRNRLEREADRVHLAPDALDRVYRGHRRREVRRRVTAGLTAGALTIAMGVWFAASFLKGSESRPASTPSSVAIVGTYRTTLARSDTEVAELGLAGTYTLRLRQNGVIQLSTPEGFEEVHESASGDAYRVTGNVLTIGSFTTFSCPGTVGTYRIELTATKLRLTPIDEPCLLRETIFGSQPWSII
jgi:hypothetical protein